MANVNFHLRDYGSVEDDGAAQYLKVDGGFDFYLTMYDVSKELFVLYPQSYNGTVFKYNDKNDTTTNLYDFRVATGTYSTTYPYDLNIGDIDTTLADNLFIRYNTAGSPTVPKVLLDDAAWLTTTPAWTLGTYATFKNEVTGYLAQCISNSRALTGSDVQPLAHSDDWSVQFYRNQLWLVGTPNIYATIVVFYPGNDPQADETIVEAI